MEIREFRSSDLPALIGLWNDCAGAGEILCVPLDEEYFTKKFLPLDASRLYFTAQEGGETLGFCLGSVKTEFLRGETALNTPAYLNMLLVRRDRRREGIGSALLSAFEQKAKALGKTRADISSLSPVNLDWLIPGTPGHGHNNMPGLDTQSIAYPFLEKRGYVPYVGEVAMYINLSEYEKAPRVEELRARLESEGITAGLYDISENCSWDSMCDRVGSEYWRKVLKDETSSPAPRPILAARTGGQIVGFTGPADVQPNGRGWFTGICTDPLYEKRGIATVLFNDLMGEFIKIGAKYTSLFTGTENHAQRLYIKTGFRPVRRFDMLRKEL